MLTAANIEYGLDACNLVGGYQRFRGWRRQASSETMVTTYQITRRHIPEEHSHTELYIAVSICTMSTEKQIEMDQEGIDKYT
jgi:hypothetical protein